MGTYYNPDEVYAIGKSVFATYDGKQPHIPSKHKLIAIMDNGMRKIAPDVTRPTEYKEFWEQYDAGWYLSIDLYLIPEDELTES